MHLPYKEGQQMLMIYSSALIEDILIVIKLSDAGQSPKLGFAEDLSEHAGNRAAGSRSLICRSGWKLNPRSRTTALAFHVQPANGCFIYFL